MAGKGVKAQVRVGKAAKEVRERSYKTALTHTHKLIRCAGVG